MMGKGRLQAEFFQLNEQFNLFRGQGVGEGALLKAPWAHVCSMQRARTLKANAVNVAAHEET